jgi:putative sugar O-methyltransferase
MTPRYSSSTLWEHNNANAMTLAATADLTNFKSNEVNFKLALWDPHTNGMRYLKTLIYNLGMAMTEQNRLRLSRIENREVGNPIAVTCAGTSVCMDYLMSVFELEFLEENFDLAGFRVLEIGAGYGRTCHAIISNCDLVSYHIIDLPISLALSRAYLERVLTAEQFAKVHFVGIEEVDTLSATVRFDLCINVDSFAEMDPQTIAEYFSFIAARCSYLYVNNPVGKYTDATLDGHSQGADVVAMAMRTGPLQQVVDIDDSDAVLAQSVRFVEAYRPDPTWECVAKSRAMPWTFYWQALYEGSHAVQHVVDC